MLQLSNNRIAGQKPHQLPRNALFLTHPPEKDCSTPPIQNKSIKSEHKPPRYPVDPKHADRTTHGREFPPPPNLANGEKTKCFLKASRVFESEVVRSRCGGSFVDLFLIFSEPRKNNGRVNGAFKAHNRKSRRYH